MSNLPRRDFLRWSLGSLAAGQLLPTLSAAHRPVGAFGTAVEKLLLIELNGGNDALTTIVPQPSLDPTYTTARKKTNTEAWIDPTIGPGGGCVAINGNTHFGLNKVMAALVDDTVSTSPNTNGHIAYLLQTGNPGGLRSHFTEMQILQTGDVKPEHLLNKEGVVPRLAATATSAFSTDLAGVSVAQLPQRWFQSFTTMLVHVRDVGAFQAAGVPADIQPHYSAGSPSAAAEKYVYDAGNKLYAAHAEIVTAPSFAHSSTRFPNTPAEAQAVGLPESPQGLAFMRHVEGALHLLQNTGCRVAGVALEGFDTHGNQKPTQDALLAYLAYAMRSVYDLTVASTAIRLTTLAVSEFGRTAACNGNNGTDHGVGSLALAMGSRVIGGVRNGSPAEWTPLTTQAALPVTNAYANALPVRTHFAIVYREIIEKLFGVTNPGDQQLVIPALTVSSGANLGFLA